jgi:HEAT repeat protein
MPLVRSNSDKPGADRAADDPQIALLSGSAEERWAAARTIAKTPAGARLLAQALGLEKDPRVREAIFTGLASISTSDSAVAILPHLRSDDANLRTGALDALRVMPDATRPHLKTLLSDSDPDVRLLACDLLRGQSAAEATQMLMALLESEPEPNVCAAAVDVLAEVGEAPAIPSLMRCADRFPSDPFLSFAIKQVIERLRPPASLAGG